jgi:hypothetical protein
MSTDVEHDLNLLVLPDERDEALAERLRQRLVSEAGRAAAPRSARQRPRRGLALTLVAGVSAAAAVVLFASTRAGGPAAASADTILRDAASVRLAPDQAASLTYDASLSGPGISSDATIQAIVSEDAQGLATRSVQTISLSKAPGLPAQPWARYVQLGSEVYGYDVERDVVILPGNHADGPTLVLPNWAFATAPLAQAMQRPDVLGSVQAAGQRTVDGTTVDVLSVDGAFDRPALHADIYFDAQTHELRGFDAATTTSYPAPSWHVRLVTSHVVDTASLPADTFLLDAPASARVALAPPDKGALARVCGQIAKPAPGGSLLEQCQANAPGVTADELVAALGAPMRSELASAVAAGQLAQAQAQAAAADADARLRQLITQS